MKTEEDTKKEIERLESLIRQLEAQYNQILGAISQCKWFLENPTPTAPKEQEKA